MSFPNYQMFYRYTQGITVDWCVLLIDVSILWRQNCLFYPYNAATSDLSRRPSSEFQGLAAFQGMFSSTIQGKGRHSGLPASCPTSPQAEVLVPTMITSSDIVRIAFSSVETKQKYQPLLDSRGITSVVSRELFSPRLDWEQWKRA
ncbi:MULTISPECIES: DarT ssDNA thymidine ADP-ribosyltransferase family protein [unclassified Synechococcus]|uniref:DarT ssDNA thymidine ADP-ribosyltransferase family protein n=1 Tax=unclassified Synechococcus TaxID=2626047 RepID=UPI00336BE633